MTTMTYLTIFAFISIPTVISSFFISKKVFEEERKEKEKEKRK